MLKVYVNIEKTNYDGLNVEIISAEEYDRRYDEVYLQYYKSLEIFQTFLDLRIDQKDFEKNPDQIMEVFSQFCKEKAEDEMYYKWEEMEVVGA